MGLQLITPAAGLAASWLSDAKAWCRVEGTASDATLTLMLKSAIRQVESLTGVALGEQVWKLTLDAFSDAIELPRGPVLSVDEFKYVDVAGMPQTVEAGLYTLDLVSDPQWIVRNAEASWPEVLDAVNVVSVEFTTGYAAVPEDLQQAVLILAAQAFDNRDGGKVPDRVLELVQPWRKMWIGA